jgi:hypothetical protein
MKLHGEHLESGKPVCTGSVYVKVAGSAPSNPIFWAAIVVMTIGLLLSIAAGRPVFKKTAPAFEDINPG